MKAEHLSHPLTDEPRLADISGGGLGIGSATERAMNRFARMLLFATAVVALSMRAGQISAQMPAAIDAPGQTVVATLHAEGAQVYECKADAQGKPTWQIREPIATLVLDGRTMGRHYAGPTWEHIDGSMIVGKVAGIVFGATPNDIPWLRLEVVDRRGKGMLSGVTTVQRINTKGGSAQGQCDNTGVYLSVPYSAEYVFLRGGT
jgi:hypothetical protein